MDTMADHLVHPEEVDTECRRRILSVYPDAVQHNIDREGSDDQKRTMQLVINGLRNSAWMIKAMRRIPTDFRDDRYWSGEWRPTVESMTFGGASQQQSPALPWYGQPMGMPPWGMMQPQAPVVVMQSPPQAAPIVINGAAPSGPMVFQSPAETKVVQMPAPQPAQVHMPMPPAHVASVPMAANQVEHQASLPAPQGMQAASSPSGMSEGQFQAWRREQLLVETAQAASNGSDVARQWMSELAAKAGQDVDTYIAEVLAKRVADMREAVMGEAGG